MKKTLLATFLFLMISMRLASQCVNNVDLSGWSEAGWVANGNWVVQGGGTSVLQTTNGNPTFFVSPYDFINVKISGNFKTTDADDDYMGFVFSFLNPMAQTDTFNTWLFDWKRGNQGAAQRGKSLCKAVGVIPPASYTATFWNHQNTTAFTVAQNTFGGAGWVQGFNHFFEMYLTFTRVQIYIDGALVFDQADCFWPGRFGFYNYSQQSCTYSNFKYSLLVDFTALDSVVCPGDSSRFRFLNACQGLNFSFPQYQSIKWDYGDGTFNVVNNPTANTANGAHIYSSAGTYHVTLTLTDGQGCIDSAVRTVTVLPPPVTAFSAANVCDGEPVTFTDNTTASPVSWQWSFGDGNTLSSQSGTHTYAAPGNYPVTLITATSAGCADTASRSITVKPKPVANFNASTACFGNATSFVDASSGGPVQWAWNFGDGNTSVIQNPSYTYSGSGNFSAVLIVTNASQCADTATFPVLVNTNVVASFDAANMCFPQATIFTNVSSANATQFWWNFGDGLNTAQSSPVHSYATLGNFQVTLIAGSAAGCWDTLSRAVVVSPKPRAVFSTIPACYTTPSAFINHSTVSSGSIVSNVWDFGDGTNSTFTSPGTVYAGPGSYNVSLIVQTDSGCSDTVIHLAVVEPVPNVVFTATSACVNAAIVFGNTSNISAGSILQWSWDFGDGQISALQAPVHSYAVAGNYAVVLTATANTGCIDTMSKMVTAFPKPVADFSVGAVCFGTPSDFTNNSFVTTGSITGQAWNFGDGNTSVVANPSNNYTSVNSYNVTLVVQSDSGCFDTITKPATVNLLPVVNFTTGSVCLNQLNIFTNTTSIISGSVLQWSWDFGDGQTSSQQSPGHTFAAQGNYSVTLVATSDNSCVDSISAPVDVFYKPVAAFTSPEVCLGVSSLFTDSSSIGVGSISQWNYNFADGQNSSQPNPSHLYQSAGSYAVYLVVTSDHGCTDSNVQNVIIDPLPQPGFSAAAVCLGNISQFTNASSIISGSIAAWSWNFADGNSSSSLNSNNTYVAAGTYPVTLAAVSDKGCLDSLLRNVIVYDVPVAIATSTPACYLQNNGSSVVLVNRGTPPFSFAWSNGQPFSEINSLFAGSYQVSVTDINNCTASATAVVVEPAGPLLLAVSPSEAHLKLGQLIHITLSNSYNDGNARYVVSPNYGLSCISCPQFDAFPNQTTSYTVEIKDSNGCSAQGEFIVDVDPAVPTFIPNAFTPNGDGVNDSWGIYSTAVKQFSVTIFDRWGEKVFESDNLNETWDGTFKGKPEPAGVYIYQGSVVYLNDIVDHVKGTFTLLR